MKKFVLLLSLLCFGVLSCNNKDKDITEAAKIGSVTGGADGGTVSMGSTVTFEVKLENKGTTQCIWELNGEQTATGSEYVFTPQKTGTYTVKVTATTETGSDSKVITVTVVNTPLVKSKWISEIIEYYPAPGQFINTSTGNPEAANSIVGKRGMVSLGGYGGYIVFRFDHTVINSDGVDFVILGNAFDGSSEPGIVSVAFDKNGNGVADSDEWYELKGGNYDNSDKNYSMTYFKSTQSETAEDINWTDSKGVYGVMKTTVFHAQCHYPLFVKDSPEQLAFSGSLNKIDITYDNSIGWILGALGKGYADNYSNDYTEIVGTDADTKNGNKFDISDAVDKNGNKVILNGVDFIKVYTSVNQQTELLGEVSTEVCGAISLTK